MFKGIDLYSDTLTQPTPEMRQAMAMAPVGDEQRREDPTTLALEKKLSELLGFSSGLFLPTATMANQIALQLHCEDGEEVFAAENAHIFIAEGGGPAVHARVLARPITTANGIFSASELDAKISKSRMALSPTPRLISIENTTNMGGGIPWPMTTLQEITQLAKDQHLKVHCDGSRLFNAAIAQDTSPKNLVRSLDSVTLCLSKGLGCPTGALLLFDELLFNKALRLKHRMGGALRQSGILAAAGLYALEHHISRLKEDHQNANHLARFLSELNCPFLQVENLNPPTNMVFARWSHPELELKTFLSLCEKKGVRFSSAPDGKRLRAVTHLNIQLKDIELAANLVNEILKEL